jgi:hypothetical protein
MGSIFSKLLGRSAAKTANVRRLGAINVEAKALRANPAAGARAKAAFFAPTETKIIDSDLVDDDDALAALGLTSINDRAAWANAPDDEIISREVGSQPEIPALHQPWIIAVSSWVDSFFFERSPNSNTGRLWVAFRRGPPWKTNVTARGYYDYIDESVYDDLFSAESAGEYIHDRLYRIEPFHFVEFSTAIGKFIEWPRQGSRGGPHGPAGSWWNRHKPGVPAA